MPAISKTGPSLFLGIELGVDQLRASIVDDTLELVGVESVDFDSELPEYQTQGGIFTTPGEAYTTPVEMWLKGLDTLFEKLHRNYDLTKIKAIGGAAQHALVWWKSTAVPSFASLDPHTTLHAQFPAQLFSLPNTPIAQDTSSQTHGLAIEALLGGPDHMAARVGIASNASMVAAQLLRIRETWPKEVWERTGRIQLASAFLASIITGKWANMGEAEACATGAWVHGANHNVHNSPHPAGQGYWDEGVLEIVGGSQQEGRRVRGWLGDVDVSGGSRKVGNVSRYLVERYGFDPETVVAPFTSDFLASYLSLLPSTGDAVLSFGPMDTLLTPAQHYIPTRLYNLFPHPAQDANEKRKYIAVLSSRNADVPRALVRDMYTKSWSAFDRLVAIVPPGGSIGLDDKLFSFWHLQPDAYPYARVKGIYRFETGIKVNEFRDLRANPRCLLESQILSFRVKWSRMIATGVLGSSRKASVSPTPPLSGRNSSSGLSSLGLTFDPYDHTPLPTRVIATGAATNFPSMANLVGDIFNAPVFVPLTQIDSAQVVPHRNAPVQGYPSRGALGGAYVARWVWSKEWGTSGLGVFEDEMRRLLGKRWVATGGALLRTNVNGATSVIAPLAGTGGTGSGANSGTSTPYGHPGPRSALGSTVLEEEEDDDEEQERAMMGLRNPGVIGAGMYGENGQQPRIRTQTADTFSSGASSVLGAASASSAFTTPDLGLGNLGVMGGPPGLGGAAVAGSNGNTGAVTPTTPTPLTPVVAMPTAEAEMQIGLAKVAESDIDSFMTYAAIVPEFSRLETMVVKGIV
ncbi:putative D-xylulose kinase A [Psilocybe cubensis]|uniref:D-xylulose kinase A n=2 Tax=Psilocybe cubensis TaxID=181762 RepID=A0ACB8GJ64_PSICU|nr:putative D-xylulose kinase A [Psilocybe cubensis]KAH9475085.1 putative D-xylulose kinase A [Psilocybe cubensis]